MIRSTETSFAFDCCTVFVDDTVILSIISIRSSQSTVSSITFMVRTSSWRKSDITQPSAEFTPG